MDIKLHTPEKQEIVPMAEMHAFLLLEMDAAERYLQSLPQEPAKSWDTLNRFFWAEIGR